MSLRPLVEKALGLNHMEFNDSFPIVVAAKGAWPPAIWDSHRRGPNRGYYLNSPILILPQPPNVDSSQLTAVLLMLQRSFTEFTTIHTVTCVTFDPPVFYRNMCST